MRTHRKEAPVPLLSEIELGAVKSFLTSFLDGNPEVFVLQQNMGQNRSTGTTEMRMSPYQIPLFYGQQVCLLQPQEDPQSAVAKSHGMEWDVLQSACRDQGACTHDNFDSSGCPPLQADADIELRNSLPQETMPPCQPSTRRRRRDYLSEHQLRLNHIYSEQRRRNDIKHLFTCLCRCLSRLGRRCESSSKAHVLQAAYDCIIELANANKRLRIILENHGVSTAGVKAYKLEKQKS